MIEITLTEVQIGIGKNPNGVKALAFTDVKSGVRVLVPLDEASARAIATGLSSNLVLVNKMPEEKAN